MLPPITSRQPPTGLISKDLYFEARMLAVLEAIKRYADAGVPIPAEWAEEALEWGQAVVLQRAAIRRKKDVTLT